MIAEKLSDGDVIGVISPSHVAGDDYKLLVKGIKQLSVNKINLDDLVSYVQDRIKFCLIWGEYYAFV